MGEKNTPSSSGKLSHTVIWLALLFGAFVHVPLSLPGVNTQVAAFDFILIIIAIWAHVTGQLRQPSRCSLIIVAVIFISLMAHSLCIYILKTNVQLAWLLKETLKSVVLVVEFNILLTLASRLLMPLPSFRFCGSILIFAIIVVGFLASQMLEAEPFFFARTVYSLALAGLLFLLAADEVWLQSRQRQFIIAGAGMLVTAVAVLSLSKGIAGISLAMVAWILIGGLTKRYFNTRAITVFLVLSLMVIAGVGAAKLVGSSFDLLQRMDSLERSISVRLGLWSLSFNAFFHHFPWGLGLGQFWEVVVTDINLAREGHRYIHNSFFSLITELGLLGLVFAIGLFGVLVAAMRGWPPMLRPLFVLLIFAPLMIHDAHSVRMLMLVTALGLARFLTNSESAAPRSGQPEI
jgi:O-antigen ligase